MDVAQSLKRFEGDQDISAAGHDHGRINLFPDPDEGDDAPSPLGHTMDLVLLDIHAAGKGTFGQNFGGHQDPLSAYPGDYNIEYVHCFPLSFRHGHDVEFTKLRTDTTSIADVGVNLNFHFIAGRHQPQSHTGNLETGAAPLAPLLIDGQDRLLHPITEDTGVFVNQDVRAGCFKALFDGGLGLRKVVGVDLYDILDAEHLDQSHYVNLLGGFPLQYPPGTGIFLTAGHAGGAVVHDDDQRIAAVVGQAQEPGHARVKEGGVANNGNRFFRPPGNCVDFGHAVGGADAGSHTDTGMHGAYWRKGAQGIAADVARYEGFEFAQDREESTMGAAGAEGRRTLGEVGNGLDALGNGGSDRSPDDIRVDLATVGYPVLADIDPNPHGPDLFLEDAVHLLDDHETFDLAGKFPNHFLRERMDQPELED